MAAGLETKSFWQRSEASPCVDLQAKRWYNTLIIYRTAAALELILRNLIFSGAQ